MDQDAEIRGVLRACQAVQEELGAGFVEHVYQKAVEIALREQGIDALGRVAISVVFHGQVIGSFEADLVLPSLVLFELKVGDEIERWQEAQTLNYLRCTRAEIGYVVLFGNALRYKRLILTNDRKKGLTGNGFTSRKGRPSTW
jgi:GxxExxY protein